MIWNEDQTVFLEEFYNFMNYSDERVMKLTGGPGTGKAQPLSSKIYTPTGYILMKDIKINDKVLTPSGKITEVTGVYPQGVLPVYNVTFSDGSIVKACGDHLWSTKTHNDRRKKRDYTVKSTKNLINTLNRTDGEKRNHTIPNTLASFTTQKVLLSSYLMGLILSEGGVTCGVLSISTTEEKIIRYLKLNYNTWFDGKCSYRLKSGGSGILSKYRKELIALDLWGKYSYEKHIPEKYLYNSYENRIKLLNGLMDGDGEIDPRTGSTYYHTTSELLKDDISFLITSLGGSIHNVRERNVDNYRTCYTVCFRLPNEIKPCRFAKRGEYWKPKTKYIPTKYIESIEFDSNAEAQCIMVSDKEHLYVTDGLIATHNTTVLKQAVKEYTGVIGATVSHPAKTILQESLGKDIACFTIAQLLGMKMDITDEGEVTFVPDPKRGYYTLPISMASVLIIDECSMINSEIHDLIISKARFECKIIFVGDANQLPSVGEEQDSVTLNYKGVQLNETMRFSGAIGVVSDAIKQEIEKVKKGLAPNRYVINVATNGRKNLVNNNNTGVIFLNSIYDVIDEAVHYFKTSDKTNIVRLLAFKNKTIDILNFAIRTKLYGEDLNMFEKGEIVINNGGYQQEITNGAIFKVLDYKSSEHLDIPCFALKLSGKISIPVYVVDSDKDSDSYIMYNDKLKALAQIAKNSDINSRKYAWKVYWEFKSSFAVFDYAYAQNC